MSNSFREWFPTVFVIASAIAFFGFGVDQYFNPWVNTIWGISAAGLFAFDQWRGERRNREANNKTQYDAGYAAGKRAGEETGYQRGWDNGYAAARSVN